jgi:hypothetical protein
VSPKLPALHFPGNSALNSVQFELQRASDRATMVANKRRIWKTHEETLSAEQLAELRRRLSMLHPSSVEQFYQEAHQKCALLSGKVANASAIQELVTAWKQLRKWAGR